MRPAEGIRLGVDCGSVNTVAVLVWPDGRWAPLLFDGGPWLSSAVSGMTRGGGLAQGVLE